MEISPEDVNYRAVRLHHWLGSREIRWLSSYEKSQRSIGNQFIFLITIRKKWLRDLPQISTSLSASISPLSRQACLIISHPPLLWSEGAL